MGMQPSPEAGGCTRPEGWITRGDAYSRTDCMRLRSGFRGKCFLVMQPMLVARPADDGLELTQSCVDAGGGPTHAFKFNVQRSLANPCGTDKSLSGKVSDSVFPRSSAWNRARRPLRCYVQGNNALGLRGSSAHIVCVGFQLRCSMILRCHNSDNSVIPHEP